MNSCEKGRFINVRHYYTLISREWDEGRVLPFPYNLLVIDDDDSGATQYHRLSSVQLKMILKHSEKPT